MSHVLIIHDVADYAAWKTVFDAAVDIRREAGELSYQLLKHQHDPNRIVHFSRWRSLVAAKDFFESERLVEIRRQAGVQAPQFLYLEELEHGVLD